MCTGITNHFKKTKSTENRIAGITNHFKKVKNAEKRIAGLYT